MTDADDYDADAWAHLRIITAAAADGIHVRGEEFLFLVRDVARVAPDIAVKTADGLRTLIPALYPASIDLRCTDAERPMLRALVDSLRRSCGLGAQH